MAEPITLARPYAKAVFQVALDNGDLGGWSKMLRQIALVVRNEKVRAILTSPVYTTTQQAEQVLELCGDELNPLAKQFVRVVAENRRLLLMEEILTLFEALKANQEKSIDATLTTAFEVSEETSEKLVASLKKHLQRDINLVTSVDSRLIGGAVIRAGDMVIDSSVRGKLAKLAEAMKS
ncbi:MAG: F0F1 ATP synthase subunit delta [Pseudohongiellaceae bacterium]